MVEYCIMEGYNVRAPKRGTGNSAGIDVYCPEFNSLFLETLRSSNHSEKIIIKEGKEDVYIKVGPNKSILIPSGLKVRLPHSTYLDVGTKSGQFLKTRMKTGAHVIDSDYQGQVFISLFNTSRLAATIRPGQALAQLIHKECLIMHWQDVPEKELYKERSERGEGGFGSTGD